MRNNSIVILGIFIMFFFNGCQSTLKKDLDKLKHEWGYELPLLSKNDSINLLFIKAERAWYLYKIKEADSLFNKILIIDSTFYNAIAFKAWSPLNFGYLNEAMKYAANDTTIHKTIFEADYAYWINHDTATAISKFKQAYDKYPNSKTMCWCLGISYLWSGQLDNSIKYNQKALELDSHFPRAYESLGWAYYMKKDYEKAIKNFEISISYGADNPNVYRLTGYAYKELKNSEKSNLYIHKTDSMERK